MHQKSSWDIEKVVLKCISQLSQQRIGNIDAKEMKLTFEDESSL